MDVIGLTGTKFGCGIAAFWRADPEDLRILDGPDDRKRAELISERLTRWRSITSA